MMRVTSIPQWQHGTQVEKPLVVPSWQIRVKMYLPFHRHDENKTTSDRVLLKEIQPLYVGARLQNVYEISGHRMIFKFQSLDYIVYIPGALIYTTSRPPRERPRIPSSFCQKLRKHLKNKRLTGLSLFKQDRRICLTLGEDPCQSSCILDCFGRGNVYLVNHEAKILAWIFPGKDLAIGSGFPMDDRTDAFDSSLTRQFLTEVLGPDPSRSTVLCHLGKDLEKEYVAWKAKPDSREGYTIIDHFADLFQRSAGYMVHTTHRLEEVVSLPLCRILEAPTHTVVKKDTFRSALELYFHASYHFKHVRDDVSPGETGGEACSHTETTSTGGTTKENEWNKKQNNLRNQGICVVGEEKGAVPRRHSIHGNPPHRD